MVIWFADTCCWSIITPLAQVRIIALRVGEVIIMARLTESKRQAELSSMQPHGRCARVELHLTSSSLPSARPPMSQACIASLRQHCLTEHTRCAVLSREGEAC